MNFEDEKYLVDGSPISINGLFDMAKTYSEDFRNSFFRSTRQAAKVLREHGFTVEDNPDFIKENES